MRSNTQAESLTSGRWPQSIVTGGKKEHLGAGVEIWVEVAAGVCGATVLVVFICSVK